MRVVQVCLAVLPAVYLLVACQTVPSVPANTPDATPATLRLGSAGLRNDMLLTEASGSPATRRLKRSDAVTVVATANDAESGIRSLTLSITVTTTCGGTATVQTFSVDRQAPVTTGGLPVSLTASHSFSAAQGRASCGRDTSEMSFAIVASARNGAGQNTQLQPAHFASYGPDRLRVATFNLYWPGNHADSVFERWGRELGTQADVLLLTEVLDERRARLVADNAGMPHVIKMPNGDVAIAARTPLYGAQVHVVNPPGALSSNDSHILSAFSTIDGVAHQFIGTHWGIRDANDVLFPPTTSAPSRLAAAQEIIKLVPATSRLVFVGGDLNAFSGVGPQDPPGSNATAEVTLLRSRFKDAFIEMGLSNDAHCSNQRIDYVMHSGAYIPVKYDGCASAAAPSDHPFVVVTYEAGD